MKNSLIAMTLLLLGFSAHANHIICNSASGGDTIMAYAEYEGQLTNLVHNRMAVGTLNPEKNSSDPVADLTYSWQEVSPVTYTLSLPRRVGTFEDHEDFSAILSIEQGAEIIPLLCRQINM